MSLPKQEKLMVLVIDDDSAWRAIVCTALTKAGIDVNGIGGAEELTVPVPSDVELILLDLSLLGIGGLALLESLRRAGWAGHPAIIIVTALASEELEGRARELGAADYLVKSRFSLKNLVEHVRGALEMHRKESAA
jgi:DNA-binding response OmpR family regulator